MKKLVEFTLFIIYTILIFYLKKYLFLILIINLFLMYILKIEFKKALSNIKSIIPIILFTAIINTILIDIEAGVLVGTRLILVCNITYTFSQKFTYMDLANTLEKIFFFMKVFGTKPKDISLILCISVAFIPILRHEINEMLNSLRAKGFKLKLTSINILLEPFFISILKRVGKIEEALIAKGYE